MHYSTQNAQALVTFLLRAWEEILAIEAEFGLSVGGGDNRPRIEFFHDAVRAHTLDGEAPRPGGLEVLAQLPGELAGRKVYVLTNYATADLREACVRLGADAVFDKSTELDEFFAAFLA